MTGAKTSVLYFNNTDWGWFHPFNTHKYYIWLELIADALFSLAGCLMASRLVFCFSVSVEFYNPGFQSPAHLKCHQHFLLCSLKHSRQWGCYTEQHKAHFIDRLNQCREKKMINETTVWPTRIKTLMNTILGSSWPLKAKIDRFKQRVRTLTLILLLLALVSSRGKRWYNVVCRPAITTHT